MYLYNIHTHNTTLNAGNYPVKCILNTSPDEFLQIEVESNNTYFSCGIHPWHLQDALAQMEKLRVNLKDKRVVAVGEAGLDKLQGADLHIQIEVFRNQIELAVESDKPLIVHCVRAWDDLIALYKEYKSYIPWIIHGYRGNPEQTRQLAKQGFKFSIGERFNPDALKYISFDSLFCETDTSNTSIYDIYKLVSYQMGMNFDQLVSVVENNVGECFKNMTK